MQLNPNKIHDIKSFDDEINFDTTVRSVQGPSTKVQINTLSPFIKFEGGVFIMSAVKRMTAQEDFIRMDLKDKNCEVELNEDCRTRKLLEKCNCVPWEVPGFQARIHKARRM